MNYFEENGYAVGINTPYSNSIAPKCRVDYKSMMLEINKKAYLNGNTLQLSTRTGRLGRNLSQVISSFMSLLLDS